MRVKIDTDTERRLWAFIRAVETEIGGWGYAKLDRGDLLWHEVFLVPQEVSDRQVDFEATGGDTTAVERAIADGALEDPSFMWVSWHSHHKMKAFWSDTDEARIAAMAKTGVRRLLSFVGTHDGSYRLRLDVFDVLAHDIALPQVTLSDLTLEGAPADEYTAAIRSEIALNVSQIKTKSFLGHMPEANSRLEMLWDLDGDEQDLDVQQTLALRDLTERGYNHEEALLAVSELGADGVVELIDEEEHAQPQRHRRVGAGA